MELAGYFAIARRWWLVLAASVVLAGVGGFVVASQLPKVYEAEVRVLVGPLNTDLNTQRAAGQLAQTYAQLVNSQRVTDAVIRRLGIDMRPSDLQDAMTAVPNDVTRLVIIRVTSRDPEMAALLANTTADELSILGAATARPEGQVQVIDPADAPTSPSAPQVSLITLMAAFAGLLAAITCVILVEYFRDSLKSVEELREISAAPILGTLPTRLGRRRDFPSALMSSPAAERYRLLSARIETSLPGKELKTLLIAGVGADGKAGLVATGMALSFADRGIPTAMVDGNVDSPEATYAVGLRPVAELDKLIAGGQLPLTRISLAVSVNRSLPPRYVDLAVVPSGTVRDVGKADHLETIMAKVGELAQIVVVTAPPVDRSPEALLWARLVDAVVLVVPHPGTRRHDVSSSVEALDLAGVRLVGTILTDPPASGGWTPRRRTRASTPFADAPSGVAQEILSPRNVRLRSVSEQGQGTMRATGEPES